MSQTKHLLPLSKAGGMIILAVAMIIYPSEVLSSATDGLVAWTKYVVPALFPFIILSELLMAVGFVHLLGVLMEPVMRPIFRLPGCSAFVVTMGFTSGPPIAAILTAKLFHEKLVTRIEAERLITFTNNCSPGFMLGAVAAGMFGNPGLGIIFAFSNYLANLLLGIALRFYGGSSPGSEKTNPSPGSIWRRSVRVMSLAQGKDNRPIGQLIGDAVKSSTNTILLVGGFIILFSVLLRLFSILGIIGAITKLFGLLLSPIGFDPALLTALAKGLFETTLGIKEAASAAAPEFQKILLVSAALAWSGISSFALVASCIAGTGIRMTPFVIGRIVQSTLAMIFTLILLNFSHSATVFAAFGSGFPLWKGEALALGLAIWASVIITGVLGLLFRLLRHYIIRNPI